MPFLLKTVLEKIPNVTNETNRQLISDFHKYLVARDTSESHQKHNVKIIIKFAEYLKEEHNNITFYDVKDNETVIQFLDKRRKNKGEDPEQKWITTWNDYLWRLKYFLRWLNCSRDNPENIEDWTTPEFVKIKSKKTKITFYGGIHEIGGNKFLARRLKELEKDGILERQAYNEIPKSRI